MSRLAEAIDRLKKERKFFSFDLFIIGRMNGQSGEMINRDEITEQMRLDAYHECMRRIGVNRVAAVQTIQKWFGIHGSSTPDRETVFKLAFAMCLSDEETEEYLIQGIGETGVQINDYRELFFLYSLHKGNSYEEALCQINEFEEKLPEDIQMISHNETSKLWGLFALKKDLDKEGFMLWMLSRGSYFKGYGMTALNCLQSLKKEILTEVISDAQLRLQELLEETCFFRWEKEHHYPEKKRHTTIPKFISEAEDDEGKRVSEDLGKNILELLKMSELPPDSSSELLLELYASVMEGKNIRRDKRKRAGSISWNLMDNKYLSELLNVGEWKERQMRLRILQRKLDALPPAKRCPANLMIQARGCGYPEKKKVTVAVLRDWVDVSLVQAGRRVRIIQRQDLLPLILTVAQLRYLSHLEQSGEMYQAEEGRHFFMKLADTTLTACCMEKLNVNKYRMDALFWNCYQQEEMYSVSDILELI